MRVFCSEHNRSFFAPRQNPIKCGNRGHTLGELDFEGQAEPVSEIRWHYCCNCEHFCPVGQHSLERCSACARQVSELYLCDRCNTICFESNTPVQTKNFTVTSDGMPHPACPGCLRPASADMREHSCDEFGAAFVTALNTCPFCKERLDVGPSFPAAVAYYLKRTKSGNKLNVTFDFETELFVPIEDGEFVLIRNANDSAQSIVLPRETRFATSRQFYDFYEDYYHCADPSAGEVQIIEPVTVEPFAGGWKLKAPGLLEILRDQPRKKKVPLDLNGPKSDYSTRKVAEPPIEAMREEAPLIPCADCGSMVETRYAFCWHCGRPLLSEAESSTIGLEPPKAINASTPDTTEETESAAARLARSTGPLMLSNAFEKKPGWSLPGKGGARKVIALAVIGLMLVSLSLFVARWALSSSPTVRPLTAQAQLNSAPAPAKETERNPTATTLQTLASPAEDDVLKKLRDSRLSIGDVPKPGVLSAFSAAEKRYPLDYRFSYERAKLATKMDSTHVHTAAFAVLFLAAAKAIDNGKADEMLSKLEADKYGDFHKLAHGHDEWTRLEQALKDKDKRMLGKIT